MTARQHSQPHLVVFGGIIILYAWIFFCCASEFEIVGFDTQDPRLIVKNTLLTCGSSGISFFFITIFESKQKIGRMNIFEPVPLFNSILAGLISSTGSCGYVDSFGASVIGVIAGFIYCLGVKLVKRFEIDDPLEVTQTHLACGVWGVIAIGLLHTELGLFYVGKPAQLSIQLLYIVVLVAWGLLTSVVFYLACQTFNRLRIDQIYEIIGIDLLTHSSRETLKA